LRSVGRVNRVIRADEPAGFAERLESSHDFDDYRPPAPAGLHPRPAAVTRGFSRTASGQASKQLRTLIFHFRRGLVYWLPLALLSAMLLAHIASPQPFERFSLLAFDIYQRAAPRESPKASPILIVDIDERSLKEIGQWPWPRGIVAGLLDKLIESGAAVVAFDVLFSEPDRTSPENLLKLLARRGADGEAAKRLVAAMPDPDGEFAAAIARAPVVTGFNLATNAGSGVPTARAGFASVGAAGENPLLFVRDYRSAIAALPELQNAAKGNGFVNQISDWDNVVRRVPLVLRLNGKPVPSLALEAMRVGLGARPTYILRYAGAQAERSFGENTGLNAVQLQIPALGKALAVPTDAAGRVALRYARHDPDRFVSAADIISGRFDPARVADHIVLVGASAAGLNDLKATPLAPNTPGVEIQAQLIEQILEQDFLFRPDWGVGAELLFSLLAGIALILTIPRFGALPGAAVAAVALIAALAVSWLAYRNGQVLLDPVYPAFVLASLYVFGSLLNYRLTERRQREIRAAFSRYMSPHYVEQLARHPEKLALGGESRLMTIMFCDIRGFTALSEGMSAAELGRLINRFLSPMTEIIMSHQGTIDKYIGDCIMAFWNAPLEDPEHAGHAVAAAEDMRRELAELNRALAAEGRRTIEIGIGINTGECSVGNFGSTQRFNYSLLGDPVNLASRLEGLTKLYGVDLVIGEETAALLGRPDLVELDLVAVKGKTRAVRIFTLPPHPIAGEQYLAQHAAMLDAYRRRDWQAALGLLEDPALAAERDMAPVYGLFRQRIAELQADSPPSDWDGVFIARDK
jgi:adenylate cyclase